MYNVYSKGCFSLSHFNFRVGGCFRVRFSTDLRRLVYLSTLYIAYSIHICILYISITREVEAQRWREERYLCEWENSSGWDEDASATSLFADKYLMFESVKHFCSTVCELFHYSTVNSFINAFVIFEIREIMLQSLHALYFFT